MCEAEKQQQQKRIIEEKSAFLYNLYNKDGFENTNSACCV